MVQWVLAATETPTGRRIMERRKMNTDPPKKVTPLTLVPLSAHADPTGYPGTDASKADSACIQKTDSGGGQSESVPVHGLGARRIGLPLLDAFRERWRHILGLDDPKMIADLDRDYDADGRPTPEALASGRVQRGGKATW